MNQFRSVQDAPIFHRLYDLYKLIYGYYQKIPKSARYTLWQNCETTTLALIEVLLETGQKKGVERYQTLCDLSNKLDLLKVLIRLAKDTRIIDNKQYVAIQLIIQEIGKMIGGWMNTMRGQIQEPVPR